jgi:long-chain fatty acid transport protein
MRCLYHLARSSGVGVLKIPLLLLIFCWFGLPAPALGAGFALIQQGTAAMAQGNAFVAEADDASAIFYNPAGITQLKRPQFYFGSFLNYPDRSFHGFNGQSSETNHRLYRALTVYQTLPVSNRVTLGLGMFSPFGLGTVWPPTWAGRYLTTFSSLKTYNVNPTIAVKPLENLSVGAGIDVLWSTVRIKKKTPTVATVGGRLVQFADSDIDLGGDGVGCGYNLGVLYEPIPDVKLGVSYRSEISVTHRGDMATTLPADLGVNGTTINGNAGLTYPPSVTFGLAYARIKPFTFEFDTTWTGWSTYDQLRVDLQQAILVNGVLTKMLVTPKNWHDAWAFRFGANYEVKPGMKLRCGYVYDLTPVPDDTFDPQVPDANRHIFTLGGDLKIQRFTLGIAYNFILSETRTKNDAVTLNGVPIAAAAQANGTYRSNVHSLGLSLAFQF